MKTKKDYKYYEHNHNQVNHKVIWRYLLQWKVYVFYSLSLVNSIRQLARTTSVED